MVQTIAFYDVVGIKEAFEEGNAAKLLNEFWNATDAWTNSGAGVPQVLIPSSYTMEKPALRVRTFSDSAVLTMEPEPGIDDFYKISLHLKAAIERHRLKCYVVVGRGEMIEPSEIPALGFHSIDRRGGHAYENVVGSGEAWVNVYLGDRCIGKTPEWHERYSVYAVGESALPQGADGSEFRQFRGHEGRTVKVFAVG